MSESNEIRGCKEREKLPDNGHITRVLVLPLEYHFCSYWEDVQKFGILGRSGSTGLTSANTTALVSEHGMGRDIRTEAVVVG